MPPDRPSVSIVIPTHNRAALLRRTLESLAHVRLPAGVQVEGVVVANACTDDTGAVVRAVAEQLSFPLRVVEEAIPNESRARNCGARAARGAIIAMLDDDVWCDPGWLEGLLDVYGTEPADLVAGRVTLWWEAVAKPDWFTPAMEHVLPHCDLGDACIELDDYQRAIGANYSFRRHVFDAIGGFTPGLGRSGSVLLGGSDTEFSSRAVAQGFRIYYAPQATVKHWVPPERVTPGYICSVAYHHGRSGVFIRNDFTWPRAGILIGQGAMRVVQRGLRQWAAAYLRRDPGKALQHRMRRCTAQGQIAGTVQRLMGRAPTAASAPAAQTATDSSAR